MLWLPRSEISFLSLFHCSKFSVEKPPNLHGMHSKKSRVWHRHQESDPCSSLGLFWTTLRLLTSLAYLPSPLSQRGSVPFTWFDDAKKGQFKRYHRSMANSGRNLHLLCYVRKTLKPSVHNRVNIFSYRRVFPDLLFWSEEFLGSAPKKNDDLGTRITMTGRFEESR